MSEELETAVESTTEPQVQETASVRDEKGRFIPGVSGNPGGRRQGPNFSTILNEIMDEKDLEEVDTTNMTIKQKLMLKLIDMANKGDLKAINSVVDRVDGKATEHKKVDLTSSKSPMDILREEKAKK